MNIILKIIRYIFTAPAFLGWLYVLFFCIFAAHKLHLDTKTLILSAEWRPWAAKRWRYSTTLFRGIIFQPDVIHPQNWEDAIRVTQHEYIHVEQVEDRVLLSLIIGAIVGITFSSFWWFLGLWVSGVIWQLPNFLGAVLRSREIYRGSEHECSAYAQTDIFHTKDYRSWLEWNKTK